MTRKSRLSRLEVAQPRPEAVNMTDVERRAEEELARRKAKGWDTAFAFLPVYLCNALPDDLRADVLQRGMGAVCQLTGAYWMVSGPGRPRYETWEELALAAYKQASSGDFWPFKGSKL